MPDTKYRHHRSTHSNRDLGNRHLMLTQGLYWNGSNQVVRMCRNQSSRYNLNLFQVTKIDKMRELLAMNRNTRIANRHSLSTYIAPLPT